MKKLSFIVLHRNDYPVIRMCKLLGISRSSYYAFGDGNGEKSSAISSRLFALFWYHKRRYGSRRLQVALSREGICIGRERVLGLMRALGLRAIQPRSYVPRTTQSHPHLRRSPNELLLRDLPDGINQVWVGDITYLPMAGGAWSYLAVWMDLYSRYLVGWQVGAKMDKALVIEALGRGIYQRSPAEGLVIHSDGGGQYGSKAFRKLLGRKGFVQSMTRKDNHYDNAHIESLFGRLKAELLDGGSFHDLEQAQSECFDYIELYYNSIRFHSSLDYQSPAEFEMKLEK